MAIVQSEAEFPGTVMLVFFAVSFMSPRLWVRVLAFTFFLLTAHCFLLTAKAQTPDALDTIRIDSDLVNLNVSILSRRSGSAASHLENKDFAVFENGPP